MIEINLLPGSTKKASRRSASRVAGPGLASRFRMPAVNRMLALYVGAWVIGIGALAWMHLSSSSRLSALELDVEAAVRDSTRYAIQRSHGDSLAAQEAAIAQKLQVIQEIDATRFIWPHILDEVSRALPPYVWLNSVTNADAEQLLPRFQIEGFAGNVFALTRFMQQLEASPFLRSTRLISSVQTEVDNRTVHTFMLHVNYQEPTPDAIETVPLFGAVAQQEQ
ncbi:MAG TPA: PilN domain-containing protein [Longimicrobiales bacterium]|nr:PilN domain-containing protein [Longimicrobiales bacterium]